MSDVVDSPYLLLDPAQQDAVVQLDVGAAGAQPTPCSGVLVSPDWVLTAAHCGSGSELDSATVRLGADARAPQLELPSRRLVVHPNLDLLLVELSQPAPWPDIDVRPLPAAREAPSEDLEMGVAELAGYGADASGVFGARGFVAERVLDVGARFLTVSGDGRSGACGGDSGGPLLLRGDDGSVRVAGILSAGSASCRAEDIYTRVDLALDWLDEHVGSRGADGPEPCGGLTERGRCFGEVAAWCDAAAAVGQRCEGSLRCGFSEAWDGFRCVAPEADPCQGVDELGRCEDERALRCIAGRMESVACDACGASCVLDPASARAVCSRAD